MAANNDERINRLKVYADNLEQRLKGSVPEKHKNSEASWRQMLEIDLKKTLIMIESLRK